MGTVTERGTGRKIEGVELTFLSGEGGLTRYQKTDREGFYRIHLPKGRYVVTAKHADYVDCSTSPGHFVCLGGWARCDIEMERR